MPHGFSPTSVKRPRLQVEEQLREAIASGQLKQGERLPSEAALAELFGVSRVTVREALRSLAASGLLRTQPGAGGGSFIRQIGAAELAEMIATPIRATLSLGAVNHDQIAAVRELLAVPAVRLAATERGAADRIAIHQALEAGEQLDDWGPAGLELVMWDLVGQASHNDVLVALLRALHQLSAPSADRVAAVSAPKARRHQRDILKAIAAGEADRAEEATRQYLRGLARASESATKPRATRRRPADKASGA